MNKLLKIVISGMIVFSLAGCTDQNKAYTTLRNNGYTHIQTGGYAFFMCDDKDTFATKFTAISPAGVRVSGAVCSGLFKGNTIRFD